MFNIFTAFLAQYTFVTRVEKHTRNVMLQPCRKLL